MICTTQKVVSARGVGKEKETDRLTFDRIKSGTHHSAASSLPPGCGRQPPNLRTLRCIALGRLRLQCGCCGGLYALLASGRSVITGYSGRWLSFSPNWTSGLIPH